MWYFDQSLLGVLVAWPEKLAVVSGLRAAASSTVEDPSVLSLCSNAPWFSLLPVTGAPGARVVSSVPPVHTDKPQVTTPHTICLDFQEVYLNLHLVNLLTALMPCSVLGCFQRIFFFMYQESFIYRMSQKEWRVFIAVYLCQFLVMKNTTYMDS
jgi:hypothetical protein